MENTQSKINLLEEQNSKLLAEITNLKKENAEIPELRKKFAEVEAENAKVKAENTKLKQTLEEHESRFTKLECDVSLIKEQNSQDKDTNNSQNSQVPILPDINSDNTPTKDILLLIESQPEEKEAITPDPIPETEHSSIQVQRSESKSLTESETSTTSLPQDQDITDDDTAETLDFIETVYKESVSKEIVERIREKKMRDQEALSTPQAQAQSITSPELSVISSQIKIPYNQKVEQGLIHELFEFIRGTDFMSLQNLKKPPLNSIFIKQISEIPVDTDLPPSSVPHLALLFGKAEKTGRKEKLRWYYYSEEYEKKVLNLSSEKNISDQMARTQIYDEMMQYLPGIKREYLRKMTQKARTIYTLFNGVGKDKIEYITYSVDAISSLTGTQIQNIINLYSEELDAKVSSSESQKLIGVKNSSRVHGQPKSDIETKVYEETLSEMEKRSYLKPLNCLPSEEEQTQAIQNFMNKVPCIHLENTLIQEGKHQYNGYWTSYNCICPLCKKQYQWVLGKWWVNRQGQKLYFLTCDNSKSDDTGILLETMSPHNHTETCSCFTPMSEQSSQVLAIPDQSLITCPS
ncbi:hypothetical protein Glove_628g18 [Diversispora epigaea]|uniref:Uncharacterized protein n=1 Tax=Diversispora epigaea TaxID=1348612 RepID=A0A397GDT0_9GLOM|nr:hypothetical protein Glove_628g18 [Diversispora epigaea]